MEATRPLLVAWGWLVALSLGTTAATIVEVSGSARIGIAAVVLAAAGLKARLILSRYLRLAGSRFWTQTFDVSVGGFLVIAFVIYVIGT